MTSTCAKRIIMNHPKAMLMCMNPSNLFLRNIFTCSRHSRTASQPETKILYEKMLRKKRLRSAHERSWSSLMNENAKYEMM